MPFGSAASIDWGALPPLDDTTKPSAGPAASFADLGLENSLLQPSKQPVKQLYKLALVDADGGLRIPTDAELQALITGARLPASPPPPPVRAQPAPAAQQQPGAREPTFQELLAATAKQGGPVCAHCGVTESPQWRRGPPHKAILCNACGTRYRRTNQLGPAVPSAQRKRQAAAAAAAHAHCGADALKHHNGPAAKQPRVSVA